MIHVKDVYCSNINTSGKMETNKELDKFGKNK